MKIRKSRRLPWPRRMVAKPLHPESGRSALQEVLGYHPRNPGPAAEPPVQRKADEQEEERRKKTEEKPQEPAAAPDTGEREKEQEEALQRKESGSEPLMMKGDVAAIDRHRGGGSPLPSAERTFFEPRLNADLRQVRVHADTEAARLSARLSARAFTSGNDLFFGGGQFQPHTESGRLLLAHELAHVVQQRRGVQLEQGMGRAGDSYERQADAVAERVARGAPGALNGGGIGGGGGGGQGAPAIQRYAEITGEPYDRLSDDGKMAVKDHKRDAWAESANITRSNGVLDGLKSKAKIEELSGSDISVSPPGKTTPKYTLKKFRMIDRAAGGEAELRDDCGTANQQMLGETAGYRSFVARNLRGTTEEFTAASTYRRDDLKKGGNISTTEELSGQIYVRIFEREFRKSYNRAEALKAWEGLSEKEKDRLAKKYGINQYAVPQVGQGITIGSERDMPGASESGYNFHFGFNLMASGHDYITLEDYHRSGVKYYFDMYGPASKKQSWAQAPSNVNAVDDRFTVMVVQHPESLKGIVNAANVHLEADPAAPTGTKTLDKDTQVVILRKGVNWMKVEVKSGPRAGQSGWILNKYFTDT